MPLPPFVPLPAASWRDRLTPEDWDALFAAWTSLSHLYLALDDAALTRADPSLPVFVSTFITAPPPRAPAPLLKAVFRLSSRLLSLDPPQEGLLQQGLVDFIAGLARVFPKHAGPLLSRVFSQPAAESSLLGLKRTLTTQLDRGEGDAIQTQLERLLPLLHVSPEACVLLLAGSDFFDALAQCFTTAGRPLRRAIVATVYLCVVGLRGWAMVNDQLFALQAAAEAHRRHGDADDCLVSHLVANTPVLTLLIRRAEAGGAAVVANVRNRAAALEQFKVGVTVVPRPARQRKEKDQLRGKGKGKAADGVAQVQDLFPELGAGFVSRCLDEYGDVERVVAALLGDSLPQHLADADRGEELRSEESCVENRNRVTALPARRNVFDDDEVDATKISFGKKPSTADDVLRDRTTAPTKSAIMSALASFHADDDERDDTYDAADVGGTVDAAHGEADGVSERIEEALFRAHQADAAVFGRDAETRRGTARARLREETGMADEAIEGWAVMLARNPARMRRLEAKYAFAGQQTRLQRTAWRADLDEESEGDGSTASRGRGRGGRGRGRGGRGRGGGEASNGDSEAARRTKGAHKASRANHSRREGHARKMARGFG